MAADPLNFKDKRVLVTGGSNGIGNGIARAFRDAGADVVITGHDRGEIGVLVFPNKEALDSAGHAVRDADGALSGDGLATEVRRRLAERAQIASGSSTRVGRALFMAEPASLGDGELTAKGSLNARKILSRRAQLLERLYDNADPATIHI